MKRLLLLILLFSPLANADDIRFAPGFSSTAAVTLVADANGVLQIDRSKPILIGSVVATDPVKPVDPVVPDPIVPADPLAVKVSALVASAPKAANERQAVSALFEKMGELDLADVANVRQATTIIFDALGLPAAWKKWKGDVDSFAAGLVLADVKRAWKLIGEGLLK